jgi:F-type H+-transporting ATPase subunit b
MRLAKSLSGAARLRPTTALLHRQLTPTLTTVRFQSSIPPANPDPKSKALSILDSLPGSSLITKAAILSSAAGVSIWAISNELYVVNGETLVAICLISVFASIGKFGGPLYKEWADTQVSKIRDILNSARMDHTQAVRDRIESVNQMSTVVEVTRDLFAVSKETAQLEAKAFVLEQQTAFAAEAKAVLESWVRYEAQVRQRRQKEIAETVIAKVKKELESPKNLSQILNQSLQEIEKVISKP